MTKFERDGQTLKFGPHVWDRFTWYKDIKAMMDVGPMSRVESAAIDVASYDWSMSPPKKNKARVAAVCKANARAFYEKHGIWPAHFRRLFNKHMRDIWAYEPVWSTLCFGGSKHPNTESVRKAARARPLIEQAIADEQWNIVPIIMETNRGPQELRALFGKGIWKKICHHSFTHNKALAQHITIDGVRYNQFDVEEARLLARLPYTMVKDRAPLRISVAPVAMRAAPTLKVAAALARNGFAHIVDDTNRMAAQLGIQVKPVTVGQWEKTHARLIELKHQQQYSSKQFGGVEKHLVQGENFVATRLVSPMEIATEGAAMHHCVASYIEPVVNGSYLVYSITDLQGQRVATLGIQLDFLQGGVWKMWRVQQCYGPCNSIVDGFVLDFARTVTRNLNVTADVHTLRAGNEHYVPVAAPQEAWIF